MKLFSAFRILAAPGAILFIALSCMFSSLAIAKATASARPPAGPADASDLQAVRAIAKEAYIYGFPMVDSYRIQHAYFVDRDGPEFKAPWNTLANVPRVFTPQDKAVQTPNSDTPYSSAGLDLRAEPMVLVVPPIDASRYFSIQLIDLYTHNFAYAGSRTTGSGGGNFLVAGPRWNGVVPPGITRVFTAETELVFALYRTQLFNPSDLDEVKKIQARYRVEPLSTFLSRPPPPASPAIGFVDPLSADQQRTSPEFFRILNFVLQFSPTHPTEEALMQRFRAIGVGAGLPFDPGQIRPEVLAAIKAGIADGVKEQAEFTRTQVLTGKVTSGDVFGDRGFLANDYLRRMTGAVLGIYGNSRDEAIYPMYRADSEGKPLDGANGYTLRFAPGQLPPVDAFWSMTMYELPSSLLVANPIDRYLINSGMLPQMRRDPDGGLTVLVQHAPPAPGKQTNWLPAPAGAFWIALRLYAPQPAALDGSWSAPKLEKRGN